MAQITLKNVAGKDAGTVELVDEVFGIQPNVPLMHQVVTAQLARRRAGTHSTKTRAEVRGGGAKPYRQKGTGNARQGSTNTPHYAGGGVAHGPKPRSYAQRTPKKMIKLALRSALSDRANDGKVLVVEAWNFESPKTKDAAAAIRALGVDGRVLVVLERENANAALSFRNIPEVQLIQAGELNAYDVLCNDWIVFTQESLAFVEAGAAAAAAKAKAGAKVTGRSARSERPATADAETAETEVVEDAETEAVEETATADAVEESAVVDTPDVRGFADVTAEPAQWAGSVQANEDGSQPVGFEIKGNANSMLYHLPGSRWYDATVAEVWFDTEESALAAGFTKAGARKAADTDTEDES